MSIITVILFFVLSWGLGYIITRYVKNSDNFLERNLMRIGFGIALFALLNIMLGLLHMPIDWRIILMVVILPLAYFAYKDIKTKKFFTPKLKLKKSDIYILIILLFFVFTLFMYTKGSFSYPWLEDGDPWIHAIGVKYISIEKTLLEPEPYERILQYTDPYPPAYESIFGVLFQVSRTDLIWHMKFFNSLIISLGIIFFYFFAKKFVKNNKKALFATFILTIIPCYMSHFIWAHSLVIMLIFPTLYAFECIKEDKRWKWIASIMVGAMLVTQPSQVMKFGVILFVYLLINSIINKKIWWSGFLSGFYGIFISFLWWIPTFIRRGILTSIKIEHHGLGRAIESLPKKWYEFKVVGTADRVYNFKDFFIAKGQNMINNPIGVGKVLIILIILTFIFMIYHQFKITLNNRKEHKNLSIVLFSLQGLSLLMLLFSFFSPVNLFMELKVGLVHQVILTIVSILLIAISYIILIMNKLEHDKNMWVPITLIILAFTFFGIHGASLPIQLFAFRFWMLFAIFFSLIVAEGLWLIINTFRNYKTAVNIFILILIVGLLLTSAKQKYELNTAQWGTTGSLMKYGQLNSWVWFDENIPDNSNVYYSCKSRWGDFAIIAYDKWSCYWCKDIRESKKYMLNQSSEKIYNWLKQKDYEYIVIDGNCIGDFGENFTNEKIREMSASNLFIPVHQGQGMVIFRI